MTILVVAPHPDDEAIGCGGTIALEAARGTRVVTAFLTSGERGLKSLPPEEAWRIREAEAERAAAVLGIAQLEFLRQPDWHLEDHVEAAAAQLRPLLERIRPDRVYVTHDQEWHPDHRAASRVLDTALAGAHADRSHVLAYEVWTPMATYDDGTDISLAIRQKVHAVRCYPSQLKKFRFDRGVIGLNRFRGAMAWDCAYAEVFRHLPAPTVSQP